MTIVHVQSRFLTEEIDIGNLLMVDLMNVRVTGQVGGGIQTILAMVQNSGVVHHILQCSGVVNCEDDLHEAHSLISDETYAELSSKEFFNVDGLMCFVKQLIKFKARSFVRNKKRNANREELIRQHLSARSFEVDCASCIDDLIDLKDGIEKIDFSIPVNNFVWDCLIETNSYSVRSLCAYLGVSYRQAKRIHQMLSFYFQSRRERCQQ